MSGSWSDAAWNPVVVNTPVPIMLATTIAAAATTQSRAVMGSRCGGVIGMRERAGAQVAIQERERIAPAHRRAAGSHTSAWKAWIPPG